MLCDTEVIEINKIKYFSKEDIKRAHANQKIYENEFKRTQGNALYFTIKRIFDVIMSLLAIIVLSPLLVTVGALVKITSKGPAIYLDKRVGKNNKTIRILKFRSMYSDADNLSKYLNDKQIQTWIVERKLDDDPRVTKFGKFIRKTSLDELPQLFNILKGDMSFVGPRPVTRNELNENYSIRQKRLLLSATPGLTGYWQVYARSTASYESGERQKLELAYLSKRSCWFDFKLILKTIPAVLSHKGAH